MRYTLARCVVVCVPLLSGCATLDSLFTNRAMTAAALDECRVDSRWGGFGFSTKLDPRDCEVLLEGIVARAARAAEAKAQPPKPAAPTVGAPSGAAAQGR